MKVGWAIKQDVDIGIISPPYAKGTISVNKKEYFDFIKKRYDYEVALAKLAIKIKNLNQHFDNQDLYCVQKEEI